MFSLRVVVIATVVDDDDDDDDDEIRLCVFQDFWQGVTLIPVKVENICPYLMAYTLIG